MATDVETDAILRKRTGLKENLVVRATSPGSDLIKPWSWVWQMYFSAGLKPSTLDVDLIQKDLIKSWYNPGFGKCPDVARFPLDGDLVLY